MPVKRSVLNSSSSQAKKEVVKSFSLAHHEDSPQFKKLMNGFIFSTAADVATLPQTTFFAFKLFVKKLLRCPRRCFPSLPRKASTAGCRFRLSIKNIMGKLPKDDVSAARAATKSLRFKNIACPFQELRRFRMMGPRRRRLAVSVSESIASPRCDSPIFANTKTN